MNFTELKQEVIDRGYDYVASDRVGTFVQRSYGIICSRRDWPFLEAEAAGTAPLKVTDLRKVLTVSTGTGDLRGVDRRWLSASFGDLTAEGAPSAWYLEDNTLRVYPVDESASLSVRYVKRPAELADSDEPLIPSEWQNLIVDLAVVHCLRDDDEYEEARAHKADVEEAIREMANDLMGRNHQNPGFIQRTGRPGDYR